MKINYLHTPFDHIIIDDYFKPNEVKEIKYEIQSLRKDYDLNVNLIDDHHINLKNIFNTDTFLLDNIYKNCRHNSSILNYITKIYSLVWNNTLSCENFKFLEYVKISNHDNTVLHGYKNNSSYFEHEDGAVLSFLYLLHEEDSTFTGGKLFFTKHQYTPNLSSNCVLIFPSFEQHLVTKLSTKSSNIVRWSINQRIYIESVSKKIERYGSGSN